MWGLVLLFNSILLSLASLYLVYSFGAAIILWSWKPFFIAVVLVIFLWLTEIAFAALNE